MPCTPQRGADASLARVFSPFYTSAFAWNFTHGMIHVLLPLYAIELGMSGVGLGSLVALPVVLQLAFNLVGGAWVDRLGPRNVLYLSCLAAIAACAAYTASAGYAGLMLGQCLFVISRASFWPANWSLGSQLPGDRSRNMGMLNSTTNAGQITGTVAGGSLALLAGFAGSFLIAAGSCLVSMGLTALIRHRHARASGPARGMLGIYRRLAAMRPLYFAMACAFLSVLPLTVSGAFHPMLLVSEGYTSEQIGLLLPLRSIGAIVAGIALARWVRSAADRRVPFWCCASIALSLGASPLIADAWWLGACLFVMGLGSGLISVYFQMLISGVSSVEQRGSAMSYGGIGWNLSNMTTPLVVGALADGLGIHAAFVLLGALLLAYAVMLLPLHRWAFPAGGRGETR
ncbi:MAG: MFS transporter [Burkholderiales bacterium]|nr:MFS transporter [Burkholderiales bacterium]